jgi:hypothetical protein
MSIANETQKLINFLDEGLLYIYRPENGKDTSFWFDPKYQQLEHMERLLNKYNKSLVTYYDLRKMGVQIFVNGQLRCETVADKPSATIQYFRDNAEEFTKCEEKIIRIRYVFAEGPTRMTQEDLMQAQEKAHKHNYKYNILYTYAPKKEKNKANWIKKNVNFLRDTLLVNNKTLAECRYGITVEINGEIKYASSAEDYESIVSYFRDNEEEFSNDEPTQVRMKYVVF